MNYISSDEFKLLLEESHPDYTYNNNSEDEFLERGKGSDIIYQKIVTRKKDSKDLILNYIFNNGIESVTNIYDCDFFINDEKNKKEEVENKNDQENFSIDNIPFIKILEDPKIPVDAFKSFCDSYLSFVNKRLNFVEITSLVTILAKKYQYNPNTIFHSLSSLKNKKLVYEFFGKYEKAYNKKHNLKKEITLQGKKFYLSESDLKDLKKQLYY